MDDERKTGSSTYHIDRLTETNYRSWAQQLRWILDELDLWELVDGKEIRPAPPASAAGASTTGTDTGTQTTTTAMQEYRERLAAWSKKAKKARSIIGSSITASAMVYIEGIDDPAVMWQILSERFNPITKTTLLQVIKEFMRIQMDEEVDTMERHLQRVQRLKRRVEEQGETISDTVYNTVLLSSVPDTYKVAVNILESQENLTPSIIINRLLEESRKLGNEGGESSGKAALLSNTKPGKGKKSAGKKGGFKGGKKDLHCSFCNKSNHEEENCWVKHPELKPKKGTKGEAKFAMTAVTTTSSGKNENIWYVDSGASDHFSPHKNLFESYRDLKEPIEIITSKNGTTAHGVGVGVITVEAVAESKVNTLKINALYTPDMDSNLLSLGTLLDKGYEISMKPRTGTKIYKNGVLVADTIREGRLFRLKTVQHLGAKAKVKDKEKKKEIKIEGINIWHQRMAHLGEQNVRKLQSMADGIRVNPKTTLGVCEHCQSGRQTRQPSHEPASNKSTEPLGRVFSDICGPITPTTIGGKKYALLYIDEATDMNWIYGLRTKSSKEVLKRFKEFKKMVELESGKKIKILRTDGGGEYQKHVENYLKECGIKHEVTAPYSPEQNGVSERANRTFVERTKAILHDTELPKELWLEIASTVIYLKNRSPTVNLKTTSYEAWHDQRPDLSNLRVIGSTVYVHISKDLRTKLDYNTRKCQLVGYGGTNQWRMWDKTRQDVIVSRDVVFDEEPVSEVAEIVNESDDEEKPKEPKIYKEIVVMPKPKSTEQRPQVTEEIDTESEPEESDNESTVSTASALHLVTASGQRSKMDRTLKGKRLPTFAQEDFDKRATAKFSRIYQSDEAEPTTLKEAMRHPKHSKKWENSTQEEFDSLIKNKTWKLVPRPKDQNVIGSKWAFKHKKDALGKIARFKSRVVAKGYTQVYGVDYLDTFAPVAKLASLRIILAIAAVEDLEIHQMDVVAAFLAEELEELIYMEQPEGFVQGTEEEDLVCQLNKSIYGLKQSARLWNRKIRRMLLSKGYYQTHSDHCVFVHPITKIIVAIWVDDIIIAGKTTEDINELKDQLNKAFEMKDLGELKYFLGMQVYRDRMKRQIHINQSGYIKTILERFNLLDCNPVSTPIATGTQLRKSTQDDNIIDDPREYQSITGSQMYAMLCTRPDTAYAISQLSQYNNAPNKTHYAVVKRVLRYLKGTIDKGITFSGSLGLKLELYCDADWASGEDRKSISAYIGMLAGGAITWRAKKQSTVATSSTEAEYMALLEAVKESVWIQQLLKELGRTAINTNTIYDDNQGAIALAHNPEHHARTKHIDIQYHFVRECVENEKVSLEYCPTADMVADALTKPLARDRHQMLMKRMGLETWPISPT